MITSNGLTEAVLAGIEEGLTNAEIIERHPDLLPKSIRVVAWKFRNRLGLPPERARSGPLMRLPVPLYEAMRKQAIARKINGGAYALVRDMLEIIVKDELFNAILGDLS